MAGSTGLEPAASGVTGRRSNQLNYDPKERSLEIANRKLKIANLRLGCQANPDSICHLQFAIFNAAITEWAVQGSNL
jgi:hypothetical protein